MFLQERKGAFAHKLCFIIGLSDQLFPVKTSAGFLTMTVQNLEQRTTGSEVVEKKEMKKNTIR